MDVRAGGPATDAHLNKPRDVAVAPDGTFYIADTNNARIRRVDPDGTISTLANNIFVNAIDVGPDGSLYVASGNVVKRIDGSGNITTVAGAGASGFSGDGGPATQAKFNSISGVVVAGDGSIYVRRPRASRPKTKSPAGGCELVLINVGPSLSGPSENGI